MIDCLTISVSLVIFSLGLAMIFTGIQYHAALRERERRIAELERRPAVERWAISEAEACRLWNSRAERSDEALRNLYRESLPGKRQPAELRRIK